MSENTKIEWCDHTFNPWEGCQKVGPGCDNCYAETRNARFAGGHAINWGPGAPRRLTSTNNWSTPLKWNKQAKLKIKAWEGYKSAHPNLTDEELEAKGFIKPRRPRVFCASLADVFDNAVNPSWRADLFGLILKTPHLDWLLLTKRIGNVQPMLAELAHESDPDLSLLDMMPLPNVWIGATIVNQEEADRDIPKLLAVPAMVRFLSMEPLLGPVSLDYLPIFDQDRTRLLHWIIVGGESGTNARPIHPDWARRLRDECTDAGVAFLFKQWGEWVPKETGSSLDVSYVSPTGRVNRHKPAEPIFGHEVRVVRVGKKAAGRLLDGRTWNEYPVTT